MTIIIPRAPEPPPSSDRVELVDLPLDRGCVACYSQKTVQLHPYRGRECPDHVTLPAGDFQADLAEDMVAVGRADAAFAYLAAWLSRSIGDRFDRAAAPLAVREAEQRRRAELALWVSAAAGWGRCVPGFLRVRGVPR